MGWDNMKYKCIFKYVCCCTTPIPGAFFKIEKHALNVDYTFVWNNVNGHQKRNIAWS